MSRTRRATPTQTDMFAVNHLEQRVAVFAGYSWGLIRHVQACGFGEYLSGSVVTPRYAARCKRDLALDTVADRMPALTVRPTRWD